MNKPKTNLEKEACKKAKKEAIEKAIDTKKVVYADAMTHYISAQNSANNYQAQADEYVETLGITPAQKAELF